MPETTTLSAQDHPLMHQRVRITDGHPDHVGRVGVLVRTETMATGETRYTVWGNGQSGYLATGIERLVPNTLADLCDRITEEANLANRGLRRGSASLFGPLPKQSRVAVEAALTFLIENPAHAERIARYANEASKQTIQLGSH
jgi:hypothetical protein